MKKIINTTIKEHLKAKKEELTLYHGTCLNNAKKLLLNGFKPNKISQGSNLGNPKYLYLTSDKEDARWFAQEKGCDVVIEVKNIPIEFLKPDSEDEAGFTLDELLSRIEKTKMPSKFVLFKELPSKHFKII